MSSTAAPDMTPRETLAAEFVLGLLAGEDLLRARGMLARDPDFADAVARWEDHFAPLLDEWDDVAPPAGLWARIDAATGKSDMSEAGSAPAEVISLRKSRDRWRLLGGFAVVAAAALAVVVVTNPEQQDIAVPPATPEAPLLAANIPIADTGLQLEVTYLPERGEVVIAAPGLSADGVHDHELWNIRADGSLDSLGLVVPGETTRVALPMVVSEHVADGSGLVLTREPLGGKPAGADAGPVVAEGRFQAI